MPTTSRCFRLAYRPTGLPDRAAFELTARFDGRGRFRWLRQMGTTDFELARALAMLPGSAGAQQPTDLTAMEQQLNRFP